MHLSQDAITSGDPDTPVRVENGPGHLLTAGQLAEWCGRPDTANVTVKPVIDLNQPLDCATYTPSPRLAEQIRLRDGRCVFPWCQRPARSCDLDHVIAHADGGDTSSDNLACLCRLHHRMKTHAGWSYTMVEPGVFLWRSPRGYTWLRDRTGTTDLTPLPVEPPDH